MRLYYDLKSKNGFKYSPTELEFTDGDGKKYTYFIEGDANVNEFGGFVSGELPVRNPGDDDYHEMTDPDYDKLDDMISCGRHLRLYVEPFPGRDDEEKPCDELQLTALALYVNGRRYFISGEFETMSVEVV